MSFKWKISSIMKILPLKIYRILDDISASDHVRKLWTDTILIRELVTRIEKNIFGLSKTEYFMGSCFEGTTTPDLKPDLDVLGCYETIEVIQDLYGIPPEISNCWLAIQEEHTKPGYVKLLYIRNGLPAKFTESDADKLPSEIFKRDSKYRLFAVRRKIVDVWQGLPADETNGPADTITERVGFFAVDRVQAYRCRQWPLSALSWFNRKRKYNWPSDDVIKKFLVLGFFVVPVGHPHSPERDLEWRISLSLQERLLMQNLTTTQYKVYILLKLIKKDILSHFIEGKSLTSYHLKTCLFYVIENSSITFWVPENLLTCLDRCLKKLVQWVGKGFCPNYFIPEENMFEGRLSSQQLTKLHDILLKLAASDYFYLLYIKSDNFGRLLMKSFEDKSTFCNPQGYVGKQMIMILSSELRTLLACRLNMLALCLRSSPYECIQALINLSNKLNKLQKTQDHSMEQTKKVANILQSEIELSLMSNIIVHLLLKTNHKANIVNYLFSRRWNDINKVGGSFSSKMKQATFLYMLGYRDASLKLLEPLLKRVTRLSVCKCRKGRLLEGDFYAESLASKLETENVSETAFRRKYCAPCIVFLPSEKDLLPNAFVYEMYRSFGTLAETRFVSRRFWYNWAVVDSKILVYFLLYLNHKNLDSKLDVRVDLSGLVTTILLDPNLGHKETAINLLGWALLNEGFLEIAAKVFVISLALKPYHNAAVLHLCVTINEIYKMNSFSSTSGPCANKFSNDRYTYDSIVHGLQTYFLEMMSQFSSGYILSEE